jgi:serine protease inhibitor
MTGTGAVGTTATQIVRACISSRRRASHRSERCSSRSQTEQAPLAQGSSEAPTLSIANGLFVQRDDLLEQSFTTGLAQAFAAAPEPVDFMSVDGEQAINAWVAQQRTA